MNKTWQDSLRMCLQLIGRIQMTYNTMPGSLCNMLMTETRDLINLLPAEYSTSKKYLAEDLARLPDGCFLNAYAYGRLQRDLQYLGVALENPTSPNPLGKTSVKSAKKIFISHSSKDKTIVEAFTNLLRLGANISHDDIFCTSIEEMKIKNGDDIRQHIQNNVNFSDFAILLISPNYKNSEICLNEMGAVWAIDKKVKTYVLPGLKESEVGWLIDTKAAEKINDPVALAALYDELVKFYKFTSNTQLWTAQATKFSDTITLHEQIRQI